MGTTDSATLLSNQLSGALNNIGMLALPKVFESANGRPLDAQADARLRDSIESLILILSNPTITIQSKTPLNKVCALANDLLALYDAQGPGSTEVTAKARAVIDALGFGHPGGWAAMEKTALEQIAAAKARAKSR